MKRSTIILLSIGGFILLLFIMGISSYNSMVNKEESGVKKSWKNVEVQYQARMDKTKNLFAIVSKNADYERGTLKEIVEARSNATKVQINPDNFNAEDFKKFEEAQNKFGASLGKLIAISENYPDLKATQAFRDLQAEYEGMENRIAKARYDYNEAVGDYNTYIRKFPNFMFAGLFGFQQKDYFKSKDGSEEAPNVEEMGGEKVK